MSVEALLTSQNKLIESLSTNMAKAVKEGIEAGVKAATTAKAASGAKGVSPAESNNTSNDPLLRQVKALVGSIPDNMAIGNPQVLKTPYLWIVCCATYGKDLNRGVLISAHDTAGPLTIFFRDALMSAYREVKNTDEDRKNLEALFVKICLVYVSVSAAKPSGKEEADLTCANLLKDVELMIKDATLLITRLDAQKIAASSGSSEAGEVYYMSRTNFDERQFPVDAGPALAKALATLKKRPAETAEAGKDGKSCDKCGLVVKGPFQNHNKICAGKKE